MPNIIMYLYWEYMWVFCFVLFYFILFIYMIHMVYNAGKKELFFESGEVDLIIFTAILALV